MKTIRQWDELKFWQKVKVLENGCWEWQGSKSKGYGQFHLFPSPEKGSTGRAHVLAYEKYVGPVPDGLELHHECENRSCINPLHLKPVTHETNIAFSAKPVCKRGHPLSGDNLNIVTKPGGITYRRCLACARIRHHAKKKIKQLNERLANET